jgi:AraC family transcriptional regulator, transcriptional activator FtrA
VAPAHRDGGQAQYIETPAAGRAAGGLAPLLDWMRAHLHEPLTVTALARHANLAERTLIRKFHATTGTTPVKWLTAQRVERARELLESTTLPVDRVAQASGLGGQANFRRHFTMAVGVNPSTYRRTFNARAALLSEEHAPGPAVPAPMSPRWTPGTAAWPAPSDSKRSTTSCP